MKGLWAGVIPRILTFNVGVLVFFVLSYVPLPLPYSYNHVGIILFITIPLSIIMAFMLFRRTHFDKRMIVIFAGLLLLGSLALFELHFEEDGNIKFNALAALAVLTGGWVISSLIAFRSWRKGGDQAWSNAASGVDEALFTTSLMWLSPFFAELLVLLNWHLKGVFAENFENLVLGGGGFNDILFILGFATLVSSGLYALIASKGLLAK